MDTPASPAVASTLPVRISFQNRQAVNAWMDKPPVEGMQKNSYFFGNYVKELLTQQEIEQYQLERRPLSECRDVEVLWKTLYEKAYGDFDAPQPEVSWYDFFRQAYMVGELFKRNNFLAMTRESDNIPAIPEGQQARECRIGNKRIFVMPDNDKDIFLSENGRTSTLIQLHNIYTVMVIKHIAHSYFFVGYMAANDALEFVVYDVKNKGTLAIWIAPPAFYFSSYSSDPSCWNYRYITVGKTLRVFHSYPKVFGTGTNTEIRSGERCMTTFDLDMIAQPPENDILANFNHMTGRDIIKKIVEGGK